jgi:hypothetical protein
MSLSFYISQYSAAAEITVRELREGPQLTYWDLDWRGCPTAASSTSPATALKSRCENRHLRFLMAGLGLRRPPECVDTPGNGTRQRQEHTRGGDVGQLCACRARNKQTQEL